MAEHKTELPKGAIKINRGPHDAVIILDGTYAATVPKKVADAIEALQQQPTYRGQEEVCCPKCGSTRVTARWSRREDLLITIRCSACKWRKQ